jgi:hypothetical protein
MSEIKKELTVAGFKDSVVEQILSALKKYGCLEVKSRKGTSNSEIMDDDDNNYSCQQANSRY